MRIEWSGRGDEPSAGDGALRLTVFDGDTPVGAARLSPYYEEHSLLLEGPEVPSACRGRGIGRRIIREAAARAEELGAELLYADAPLDAVGFFEACGFCRASVTHPVNGEERLLMAKSFALEDDAFLGFGNRYEAVIFRGDFDLPEEAETVTAELLPCGFAEVYLNGKKCSENLYAPAWTNYSQQDFSSVEFPTEDVFCFRSYYLRLDLTPYAQKGKNAFALHIGDGWYAQWESRNGGNRPYGEKKLCYRVTARLKSGKTLCFSSSGGGVFRGSYITKTSMYFGETQDLRLLTDSFFTENTDTPAYTPALPVPRPYTLIVRQTCPPDRVLRRVENPRVLRTFGDRTIYDLGENLAGFALLRFGKGAGINERIVVRYAENLNEDGSLNFHSTGGTNRMSVDEFRNCGGRLGEETPLYPHFLWHTGRYVEVTGNHRFDAFCVAATDVPVTASFRCSDPVLNWLFEAFVRTQTDNMHCSIPSDCPHRERLGYTGDGQLTADAVMTIFDARGFYDKWMRDIADCQDVYGGHVQYTAPFYGGGGGPGGWGCAIVAIPYAYRRFYGGDDAAKIYYPHIRKYLDYMEGKCDGHIVVRAEPGGWCLGDWCTPHNHEIGILIPPSFVNTYFYIRSLRQAKELAAVAGYEDDIPELERREAAAVRALTETFFDAETGSFCGGENGADAFALDLGLGDERTLRNLVARYRRLGTFDTGIFGTRLAVKVLFDRGYGDDAVRLLANRGEVSFYHMMTSGATTLWEEWFNEYSSCHPMFGASAELLFSRILGIRQKEGSAGFSEIEVEPAFAPSLAWAEGSVRLGGKTVFVRVEHGRCVKAEIR